MMCRQGHRMIALKGGDHGTFLSVQLGWLRVLLGKCHFALVLKILAHAVNESLAAQIACLQSSKRGGTYFMAGSRCLSFAGGSVRKNSPAITNMVSKFQAIPFTKAS